MYEIELKAWLDDRQKVVQILSSIASYDGEHEKNDTYWTTTPDGKDGRRVTIRIRKETVKKTPDDEPDTFYLVTYKKHTRKTTPTGETYEVNDEKEFTLQTDDAAQTFSTFLEDAGFFVSLKKHKKTEGWYKGDYHIELCDVEKLGEFIEIETLAEDGSSETVESRKQGLLDIIDMCGIPRDRIEERYYRELLEEKERQAK